MANPEVLRLRAEYAALLAVADGILQVIRSCDACNLLTMARMAEDARSAARQVASLIERILLGGCATPKRTSSLSKIVLTVIGAVERALVSLVGNLASA